MAEPGAVVHVVRAHDQADQLLDDVAVLVGGFRGGERAEVAHIAREPVGGGVKGLAPGGLAPAALALDEGSGDAVARVDKTGAEAALYAEHPAARRVGGRVVGHAGQPAVLAPRGGDPAAAHAVGGS